jgi:hypothetical protein
LAESYKVCPICKTLNHPNATVCTTCGTSLATVTVTNRTTSGNAPTPQYDFRFGENDLLESANSKNARGCLVALVGIMTAIVAIGIVFVFANVSRNNPLQTPLVAQSETPRPTLGLATVTLGPPTSTATNTPLPTFTPSETPTRAPCVQRIVAGGSLIGAITNCGYTTLDIMPTVMALNNIADAAAVQEGQEIIIPWPSPTFDPNAPTPEGSGSRSNNLVASNAFSLDSSIVAFAPTATPTLPPGVMWYTVQSGDNLITISVGFDANAKTLSELNPEIDFAKCEFGERFGGPECLVQLSVGQQMRVPAPTPMPTLTPTNDPNATATPTATPTYNEPNIVSPPDKAFFGVNELVSLRWIPTGTLNTGEAYRIDVTDLTTSISYTAVTTDIYFLVPTEWQGRDNLRHEYQWTVGIIRQDNPEIITFQTAPRTFVWQGLAETN